MGKDKAKYPLCFGDLEKVFPKGKNGLRNSPEKCTVCVFKVDCLRSAMEGKNGLLVREEVVDRAYASGLISFFERWSKKKEIQRQIDSEDSEKAGAKDPKDTDNPQNRT